MDNQRVDQTSIDRVMEQASEVPARVMYVSGRDRIQILLGPGFGMLNGGVPVEMDLELVPFELRTPNTELLVTCQNGVITAVRSDDRTGRQK